LGVEGNAKLPVVSIESLSINLHYENGAKFTANARMSFHELFLPEEGANTGTRTS
jgi:hypothetical protein